MKINNVLNIKLHLALALTVSTLIACDSHSTDILSQNSLDIIGTWQSSCVPVARGKNYFITTNTYRSDGRFVGQDKVYADMGCTTKPRFVMKHIGTYMLVNKNMSANGLTAKINLKMKKNTVNGRPAHTFPGTWRDIIRIDQNGRLFTGLKVSPLLNKRPTTYNKYYSTRITGN